MIAIVKSNNKTISVKEVYNYIINDFVYQEEVVFGKGKIYHLDELYFPLSQKKFKLNKKLIYEKTI